MRVSGALSAAEAGADGLSASGFIPVAGALVAAEAGADAASASGAVIVAGAVAAAEAIADTFDAAGLIGSTGIRLVPVIAILDQPARILIEQRQPARVVALVEERPALLFVA
ncbi:MAG: hypothetical protein B7Z40_15660 [Bosea sp. 12-68-7]|nr:MAG: hypothetical protein B7Z40_15660 [Bosea sp. 12-68-7]